MKYLVALFFLVLNFSSSAQLYSVDKISPTLLKSSKAVIRSHSREIDIRVPSQVQIKEERAITIVNERSLEYARIVEYYDKSSAIKSLKGEILDQSGKVVGKFSLSDFKDQSAASDASLFESFRLKHFLPNIKSFPATIVYTIEKRSTQNLIIPDWNPNYMEEVSIEKSRYSLITKLDEKINIDVQNFPGEATISDATDAKVYEWSVENIAPEVEESFMPNRLTSMISVKVAPVNFIYYGKKGNYSNWNELGTWIYDNLLKDKRKLSYNTTLEVDALLKGVTSKYEKTKKLYAYMQSKTRYISIQIGIGGFEPFNAEYVDRLGYGDCKALVNYMQSLLEYAGIDSYYCVVEAGDLKRDLHPTFASMSQGNHVIVAVPIDGEIIWLECTDQKMPFGFLGTFTDDRNVLAVGPLGAKIMRTPKLTTSSNAQRREGSFVFADNGGLNGKISTSFTGSQYDNHIQITLAKTPLESDRILKQFYDINNINFKKFEFKEDKSSNPVSLENLEIFIPEYASVSEKRWIVQPNIFSVQGKISESRDRKNPLFLNRGFVDIDSIIFEVPSSLAIPNFPPPIKLEQEFGSYEFRIEKHENGFKLFRRIEIRDGTYPANMYNSFVEFISKIRTSDLSRLILEKK